MAPEGSQQSPGGAVGIPVGAKIGKYQVVERRAIGGQAIVYKCYDPLLDRAVAVKQISTHLAEDPKFVERFRREAQILARLGSDQTAIVTIHEMIEEERGLFIVMEYVQGQTLETILSETPGAIEPKAALQVLWRLAAALHVVHGAGIVHRDIKPANIIIGEGLRPKITDFGVAATVSGQTSMLLGTTKYMAPELFSGGEVDGRADMYSLGVVAYEMLLGRVKFNEVFADIVRDPHSEALRWMKWHSNEQVVAPELAEVNPAVPKPLSDIVATMMAKDRQERFESMEALGRAIRMSFSPRGRAAPAAAPAGRGRGAKTRAGEGAEPAPGPPDEGDELEVAVDSAPTAAIPRRRLSARAKAILAGSLFVVALGAVLGVVFYYSAQRARIAQAARDDYRKAEALSEGGDYAPALKAFQEVQQNYRGTLQAQQAGAMIPLTRARLLSEDANTPEEWQAVATAADTARSKATEVMQTWKDKAVDDWARKLISNVDRFNEDRTSLKRFRTEMARAQEAFADQKYDDARRVLDNLTGDFTDEQKGRKADLRQQVERAAFDEALTGAVARGEGLAELNDFEKDISDYPQAEAAFQDALKMVRASPVLSPAEAQKLAKDLEGKLATLGDKQKYRAALQEAEAASDPDKKLAALRQADRIRPSQAIKDRIAAAQSDKQYQQAAGLFAKGNLSGALAAVAEALKSNPNNQAAQALKAQIDKGVNRQQLLADGQKVYAQGDYAGALQKFVQAQEIATDEALDAKVVDCRYNLQLAEGDKLRQARQYDQAVAAYERARAIKPSEAQVIDARLTATTTLREYDDLIGRGDEAMKARQFGKARDLFTQAKAKMETPEILQRIAQAFYYENLELGKSAMQQRDYAGARAYFLIARRYVEAAKIAPAEVDDLIRQAEEKIPPAP